MSDSFPSAAEARESLKEVRRAFDRYETATKAQIAQAIFGARIDHRITVMQEMLGSLGDLQYTLELCAGRNGIPLDEYMVMVRGTADPDPSLFYPDAVEAESASA